MQVTMLKYLSGYLVKDTCWELILGTNDPEISCSLSKYEKQHATLKARHLVDALRLMIKATTDNVPITWERSYIIPCFNAYLFPLDEGGWI